MVIIQGYAFLELHEVEDYFDVDTLAYVKEYNVKHLSTVNGEVTVGKLTIPIPKALQEAQSEVFWAEDEEREPVFSDEQTAALAIAKYIHDVIVSLGGNPTYSYIVVK